MTATMVAQLTGCGHDIDDLFDKPASARLDQSVAFYDSLLQSAHYGWIMNYYPGDGSWGGCAFTAKFEKGKVLLASELRLSDSVEVGTPVASRYRVIEEQGVVLTFDTYNPLLHYFTEPTMQDVDGFKSDYEFIFLRSSADGDTLSLKGKKYGTEMTLKRMTAEDADYINRVVTMNKTIMSVPHFHALVDGKRYPIQLNDLELIHPDAQGNMVTSTFTYTPTGIEFFKPVDLAGVYFSTLLYDDKTGELRSPDGRVVILFPSNMQQFVNTYGQWLFIMDAERQTGECDDVLLKAFHRPVDFLCTIEQCFIGKNLVYPDNDANEYVVGFKYNVFGQYLLYGCYGIRLSAIDDHTVSLEGVEKAYGYNDYYFAPIIDHLLKGSPYRVEFQEGNIQKKIKLTSTNSENIWFNLTYE